MYNIMSMGEEAYRSCKRDAELDRRLYRPVLSLGTLGRFRDAVSKLPDGFEALIARSL